MVKVNLKGVAVGFAPVDEGRYKAVFTGHKNGMTSGQGKIKRRMPKIALEFTIDSDAGDMANKRVFLNQTLNLVEGPENNLHFFKQTAVMIGADPDDLDDDELDTDEILGELKGNAVVVDVSIQELDDGRKINQVRLIDPDTFGA